MQIFRVGVGGNANFSVFRYQHVGTGNAKSLRWECNPKRGLNTSGFESQWNIGFRGEIKIPHSRMTKKNAGKHWLPTRETYARSHKRPFAPSVGHMRLLC